MNVRKEENKTNKKGELHDYIVPHAYTPSITDLVDLVKGCTSFELATFVIYILTNYDQNN